MRKYNFSFGGVWLSSLGGQMEKSPDIEIAKKDIKIIDIPGKDGSEIIDNGRYSNVEMSRSIAFVSKNNFTAADKSEAAVDKFAYLQGYQDFEDTDHPGMITKAVLLNFDTVVKNLRRLRTAELVFSRYPYWYDKKSLTQEQLFENTTGNVDIVNPYPATYKPTLLFYFTAPSETFITATAKIYINTTINGKSNLFTIDLSIKVNNEFNICRLDFDKQNATIENEHGIINSLVDIALPKEIGQNRTVYTLSTNTNLLHIDIIPKWRCL